MCDRQPEEIIDGGHIGRILGGGQQGHTNIAENRNERGLKRPELHQKVNQVL